MSDTPVRNPSLKSSLEAYEVQGRVAIGTAGIVYRAIQTATGEEVLFKLLSGETSHPLDPAWVMERAPALRQLRHPRISVLLDAFRDPEGFVLVYSYQPGWAGNVFPSLRLIADTQEAERIAIQILEALLVGEKAGIPHGDVKPSNLIVSDQGKGNLSIQLLDWGMCECRAKQPPETLQFMAPERLEGGPVTVSSDLFSAAGVLWYLLTGHAPVDGRTRESLKHSWQAFDPGTLLEYRPDLAPDFVQWMTWLMKPDPLDRPGWVAQALEVLTRKTAPRSPAREAMRAAPPPASISSPTTTLLKPAGGGSTTDAASLAGGFSGVMHRLLWVVVFILLILACVVAVRLWSLPG